MYPALLTSTRRGFFSPFRMHFSSFFPSCSSSLCSSFSYPTQARRLVFITASSTGYPDSFPTADAVHRSHAMCCRRSPVPAFSRGLVSSPKRWISVSTLLLRQPPHPPLSPPTSTHHSDLMSDTTKDAKPARSSDTMTVNSFSSSTERTNGAIRTENHSASSDTSHTFAGEMKGDAENRNEANGEQEASNAESFVAASSKRWRYPHLPRLFFVWQQGVVASIGIVMGLAAVVYLFSAPMKEDTVHHTAVLASEALQNLSLQKRAIELSTLVVQNVLSDPNSLNLTIKLVVELLGREEIKIAISSLLSSLFEDRYTQEVTKKFILQILRDRWVSDQLDDITKHQIQRLLVNQEIKDELAKFLTEAASDALQKQELHDLSATAIRSTFLKIFNPFNILSSASSPQTI